MESKVNDVQWLTSILRNMGDAVIATDKKGVVTFTNSRAESLTGWSRNNALGQSIREVFKLLDSKKRTPVKVPTPRSFQKSRKQRDFSRLILLAKDGKETVIDASLTPVQGSSGKIDGSVLIFRDISKRLLKTQRVLDRHKVEAIGNIARSIAHDYSSRLSAISGHASSITDSLIPKTRAYNEALKILEATDHAGGLTKRLMSVAKASNIEKNMKVERVDLGELVRDAISLLEGTFTQKKIYFKVPNLEIMPWIRADTGQFLDCLINLFYNAADAMPDGGTITIDAAEKKDANRNFVVLRVRDTGSGMSKDVLDQIFEPFFSTNKSGSAIGLGLTIVRSSLQRWGGSVKVRSRPGHGTSFRLFIPRAKVQPSKERMGAAQYGGETVLLADDKKDLLVEARDILEKAGYKVHVARNGNECVSLYKRYADEISLSIIDVVMPGKDGKHVLRDILELDPTALIIMTSGFSRDYVRGYLKHGTWGFIQKPLDGKQLLSNVRRALDQKITREKKSVGPAVG